MASLPIAASPQMGERLSNLLEQFLGIANEAMTGSRSAETPPAADTARLARRFYAERRRRAKLFPDNLFGEPAWDILLDLFAAQAENKDISVTSACIAAQVPTTTGLRHIQNLEAAQLIERHSDPRDHRRVFVRLRPEAFERMRQYLVELEGQRAISL